MAIFTLGILGSKQTVGKDVNTISAYIEALQKRGQSAALLSGPDALGYQVDEITATAVVQILQWLQTGRDVENSVNMTGFSRGAVICTRIANAVTMLAEDPEFLADNPALKQKLASLRFNICVFDPVAGLMDKSNSDARLIPANVNRYVAFLQEDEGRRDFKSQGLTRLLVQSPATALHFLPMYGNHSDVTVLRETQTQAVPELAAWVLYQMFETYGSGFGDKMPSLVDEQNQKFTPALQTNGDDAQTIAKQLLAQFSDAHEHREYYRQNGTQMPFTVSDGAPIPRGQREFILHKEECVHGSEIFLNQLEREAMKVAYPLAFNYFFEMRRADPSNAENTGTALTDERVIKELRAMQYQHGELYARLKQRHYFSQNTQGQIELQGPRGYAVIERCAVLQMLLPGKLTPQTAYRHSEAEQRLAQLQQEITQVTWQYVREKPEVDYFHERLYEQEAGNLRVALRDLLQQPGAVNKTDVELYQQAISLLQERYAYLATARPDSPLCKGLAAVLERQGYKPVINNKQTGHILAALPASAWWLGARALERLDVTYTAGAGLARLGHLFYAAGEKLVAHQYGTAAKIAKGTGITLALLGTGIANALPATGQWIEDLGRRFDEQVSYGNWRALKWLSVPTKWLCAGLGAVVKHQCGLSLLTQTLPRILDGRADAAMRAAQVVSITQPAVQPEQLPALQATVALPTPGDMAGRNDWTTVLGSASVSTADDKGYRGRHENAATLVKHMWCKAVPAPAPNVLTPPLIPVPTPMMLVPTPVGVPGYQGPSSTTANTTVDLAVETAKHATQPYVPLTRRQSI